MNLSAIKRELVVDPQAVAALPGVATLGQLAHVHDVLTRRASVLAMSPVVIPDRLAQAEAVSSLLETVRVELERRGVRIDT